MSVSCSVALFLECRASRALRVECRVLPLIYHVSSKGGPWPHRGLTQRTAFKVSVTLRNKHSTRLLWGVLITCC